MKIYFAGAITKASEEDVQMYAQIIKHLNTKGEVLTEHVGDAENSMYGNSAEEIRSRDLEWLDSCHVVVAEVTRPSHGVGMELERSKDKKVLCLHMCSEKEVSNMIKGVSNIVCVKYSDLEEAKKAIDDFFSTEINK